MSNPSLLCVPYRFKTSKLYSQIPDSGLGDFTVTRTTTPTAGQATRVNAAGLIELVADNVPRLDYPLGGITAGCPALLVEPSAQNLCLQSEDLDIFPWNPTNTAVTVNVTGTTDPAGGNKADQIFETAASGLHFLAQTMTIVNGTTYAGSVFLKKATGSPDWMQVAFSTTGLAGFANFNLTSGTVGNALAGCTGRIENYGNGWYRCTLIQTANANGTSGGPIIVFTNNTNSITRFVSYTGNTATSIYAWGAQFEASSVPTSYIPTAASPVTRGAETISKTGVSSLIGQTEGTIYAELNMRNFVSNTMACFVSDGTGLNSISLQIFAPPNSIRVGINRLGVGQIDFIVPMPSGVNKIALGYAQNNVALYLNGTSVATSSVCLIPATSRVDLGNRIGTGNYLNDRIGAIELYPTRLPNTGPNSLQSLTQ